MDRAKCQIINPGKISFSYSAIEYAWLPRDLTTRQCGEMGTRHIPVWEEKGTSHSCGQQTSNRGHVPGSPGHTWGHIKRGNNSDWGAPAERGGVGMAGLRALGGTRDLPVATSYRSRAAGHLTVLCQPQRLHTSRQRVKYPPLADSKGQWWSL